jgi:hypothetical protein
MAQRTSGRSGATRTERERGGWGGSRRTPFVLLAALMGATLCAFAVGVGSLPVVPVVGFVCLAVGAAALPDLFGFASTRV